MHALYKIIHAIYTDSTTIYTYKGETKRSETKNKNVSLI